LWGPGPTSLGVSSATIKEEKETDDYTNFNSGGFSEVATCVAKASGGVKSDWNAFLNPFALTPTIYPNDNGGPMLLYQSLADGTYVTFPIVAIPSCNLDMDMSKKLVKFDFDYMSNGIWSNPTLTGLGQING
jgi:hypothetical protein